MKGKGLNLLLFVLFFWGLSAYAQNDPDVVELNGNIMLLQSNVAYFLDEKGQYDFQDIQRQNFINTDNKGVLNFGFTRAQVWLKFKLLNHSKQERLLLMVRQPAIDSLTLFTKDGATGKISKASLGKGMLFKNRLIYSSDYIFPIDVKHDEVKEIYLKIFSKDQLQVPIFIGNGEGIFQKNASKNLLFGLYAGAVLIMMLYNFFISISTRDHNFIIYILYILSVGLTQATFQGYGYMYLWPSSPLLASYSSIIVPFFSGLMTIAFLKGFLHTKQYAPRLHVGINFIVGCYIVALIVGLFDVQYGAKSLQITASLGSVYVLILANYIRRLGYRPALFFLIAFSLFLCSVILFVLRNFGLIPYNTVTSYILEIGSILEISFLSFALADRINFYRKEKEVSQLQALEISRENERIISEQNVFLEREVAKRTAELERANVELNEAMANLKQAQAQLVESEKLASLGMLTAGIAHEINNPINFVTSNVRPLRRDIQLLIDAIESIQEIGLADIDKEKKLEQYEELKQELEFDYLQDEINALFGGIQEGALRTAEIVKSLRVFSRVDEDDLKLADLNLGLESTLVILNTVIKEKIVVEKDYGSLPLVECFPGKLNQVFLNLITNAIHAIEKKFGHRRGGVISIKTYENGKEVFISIKDNGMGIPEEIKNKIFEPFFTTKEIGEGTGLGLAIVLQTVNKHQGKISLITEVNEGCEFIVQLPITQVNPIPFVK